MLTSSGFMMREAIYFIFMLFLLLLWFVVVLQCYSPMLYVIYKINTYVWSNTQCMCTLHASFLRFFSSNSMLYSMHMEHLLHNETRQISNKYIALFVCSHGLFISAFCINPNFFPRVMIHFLIIFSPHIHTHTHTQSQPKIKLKDRKQRNKKWLCHT